MKVMSIGMALLASVALVAAAKASNDFLLLNPDDLVSQVVLDIDGDSNRLTIEQITPGEGLGNSLTVKITGDRNGGPIGSLFDAALASNGLAPGAISQNGFGNSVNLEVNGNDNLFAISQIGNNNAVVAQISGLDNQSSIVQSGNGNFTSFSQNGIGNMISVRQISW